MSEENLKYCKGCTNDFYNGNNTMGVKRCWSLPSAEVVQRVAIHVDRMPPYMNVEPETTLNCHTRRGYVMVKPEAINPQGYWRS